MPQEHIVGYNQPVVFFYFLLTARKDETKRMGSGWERFDFNKDAPLDDNEIEGQLFGCYCLHMNIVKLNPFPYHLQQILFVAAIGSARGCLDGLKNKQKYFLSTFQLINMVIR